MLIFNNILIFQIDRLKKGYESLLHFTYLLTNGKLLNKPAAQIEPVQKQLKDIEIINKIKATKALSTKLIKQKKGPYYYDTKQPGYLPFKDEDHEIKDYVEESEQKLLTDGCGNINVDDIINNKIQLTEQQALSFASKQTGWPMFQDVFMISAKHGNGIDNLLDYIVKCAYSSPWIYHEKVCDKNVIDFLS